MAIITPAGAGTTFSGIPLRKPNSPKGMNYHYSLYEKDYPENPRLQAQA